MGVYSPLQHQGQRTTMRSLPDRVLSFLISQRALALALVVFETFFIEFWGLSGLLSGLWLFLILISGALRRPGWNPFLNQLSFALLLCLISLGGAHFSHSLSRQKGEMVFAAIERFKDEEKRYPATLDDLVPKYLSSEDQFKRPLSNERYGYYLRSGVPELFYRKYPYVTEHYSFKTRRWAEFRH